MTLTSTKNIKVFFSYSHKDEKLRDKIEVQLSTLKRKGIITSWHNRKIGPGEEWRSATNEHLNAAHIILLLISPDFLASDYCYDVEMKQALKRHEANAACVIPIILRPVDWRDTPFEKLHALPTNAKAVTNWKNRDDAFLDIAIGIRSVIEEFIGTIPS